MINEFSHKTRQQELNQLQSNSSEFDLVIIGGGITGAGVARDAASRGMKVLLVEARDFAFGTSSRSSKLIHGGIRYLENLEFGLVFEALRERRLLFELAPHLVHPLRFVLPVYHDSRVGMFKMGLGMWLYDALAMFEMPEMHERLNKHQCLFRLPLLKSQGLEGAYVYSDAYMDDDRLVIETLRSAQSLGAKCFNYVSAEKVEMQDGQVVALNCTDQLSGSQFKVRAKHFVSTVGPWTDQLGRRIFSDWKNILRPSKGIHLTFSRSRIPLRDAVVMPTDNDSRIVFGIPRHEMIIVGTTDTDYPGDPAEVKSTAEDVLYLLNVANEYFPGAKLTHEDILASYSGVRPLVHDGSATESKTSREHVIISDPRNVTFVSGGKYTTYRHMAEQTLNQVLGGFTVEERVRFGKNNTKVPLNPEVTEESLRDMALRVEDLAQEYAMSSAELRFLIERHGPEAEDILNQGQGRSLNLWQLEALHAIQRTQCLHLRDFYLRRSPLFLAQPDHGFGLLKNLAAVFAQEFGWDEQKTQQEIQLTQDHLKTEMGWRHS